MITPEEHRTLVRRMRHYLWRWRRYPLAFVMEACRAREYGVPCRWQAEALAALEEHKKVVVASGHGVGKSRFLAWVVWWMMVCMRRPGKPLKIPCTGPSGSNIEDVLWSEVALVHEHLHPFIGNQFTRLSDSLYFTGNQNDWFATLRTSRRENPDALQGFHGDPMLFVIDEAAGVPDEIFEVARGALSGKNSYAVMTGNPTRLSGYFHDRIVNPGRLWRTMRVSCEDELDDVLQVYPFVHDDTSVEMVRTYGRVTREYVRSMRDEFGAHSPTYKARVLGLLPSSEQDQVVKTVWAETAAKRAEAPPDLSRSWIMGVDVAYQGDDSSALVTRRGDCIGVMETWHGNDPTESADRVDGVYTDLKKRGAAPRYICVDVIGVGAGVYSDLRRRGLPVLPVDVAAAAPSDGGTKCYRLRDWLWWQCRLLFRDGAPWFTEPDSAMAVQLRKELCAPLYDTNKTGGKVKVESKQDLKKRKVRSPNLADALNNTFYVDYASRPKSERADRKAKRKRRKSSAEGPSRWKVV